MRYLKLYEDFNTDKLKIKDLLEDIVSLDYILSDEGITAKYYVTEKMASDSPNRYMIGTSDDISTKADESFDGVGIYKIQVYFDTTPEMKEIPDEYYNQLKEHLEEVYDVHVVKDRPHTTGKVNNTLHYKLVQVNCVSIIIERQPDDYVYFDDEDEDINESVDDETAMKHYGIYPEDVKEMFYDLQDLDIFPEMLRVFVEFKSKLGQLGHLRMNEPMSDKVMQFQHFPYIEVRVKSDAIKEPAYGGPMAYKSRIHTELELFKEDERFKEVIEVANNRLEDYGWTIERIIKNIVNDYLQIIIEKI
jgi:hypothetical protein